MMVEGFSEKGSDPRGVLPHLPHPIDRPALNYTETVDLQG